MVALAPGWMPTSRSSKRRFRRSRRHRPSSRSPTLLPLSSACLSLPSISWIVAGLYQVHASRPDRSIAPRGPNGTAGSSRGSTPFAANSPPCRRHNPTGDNSSSSDSSSDSEPILHGGQLKPRHRCWEHATDEGPGEDCRLNASPRSSHIGRGCPTTGHANRCQEVPLPGRRQWRAGTSSRKPYRRGTGARAAAPPPCRVPRERDGSAARRESAGGHRKLTRTAGGCARGSGEAASH